MLIPIVIGVLYLASAGLFWHKDAVPQLVAAVVLSPISVLLTLYLRRLAAQLAASAYLQETADAGLSKDEAIAALEHRTDGITIDTDDVAQWPFTTMLVVSVGSLVMLFYATASSAYLVKTQVTVGVNLREGELTRVVTALASLG